ncbi:uncharacterized protein KGF55_000858 [Candida pseudojiufengensis]|uniref:uncharacterized protein n=1 Tax=Candida pseudojiufengensis TaxID=497109 RepID=UPI002223F2E4|nr:uncharacterized protein KGF55_000858 [Candida pseudojiufengensis]KAI5966549.1 hypothetical protein KGF55_000858 [Candida pseudojiufengensis]
MSTHVTLVTGASKGIGKAIVDILLQHQNSKVVAIARSKELLETLQSKYGSENFQFIAGDVTDSNISQSAIDLATTKFGQLNSIIANAGIIEPVGPIQDISIEEWKKLYDLNFFSIVQLIQQSLSELKRTGGNIIAVSSGAANSAYSGWYAYGSSKAALNHLIKSLAAEEKLIKAISIAPGVVNTDMQELIRNFGSKMNEESLKKFINLHKDGKLVEPEICGKVYANLALKGWSDDLNGEFIRFDDAKLKDYQ